MKRFESFFLDKLCRQDRRQYFQPLERLLGEGRVRPATVLDVIERIPDEFRDPHYRSQAMNLFLDGQLLVDRTIAIETLEPEFSNAMSSRGLPGGLPHVLSTNKMRENPEVAKSIGDPSLAKRIAKIYRHDFRLLGYEFPP